jgi:ATP-dependent exoDNAse (exonuclease V) alpha subunit
VSAGEWLAAEGWWVRDKEHGLQFKATTLKTVPPTTVEGIERYLGSGLVKGIGPVLASKLVEKFGKDVLSVIEYRSPELQRVDGIGPKRRERIKRAWQEAKQVREIMLFLHGHGVSTSRAVRIFKAYGEPLIFLPHLRRAEEGVAAKVKHLVKAELVYPPIDFEKAVAWCEKRTGKTLASSQREALKMVLANRVVIITGGPGVGKTTLVNSILTILNAKRVKCLLCAPTGRAAKRLTETTGVEAKTIHRLLEVDPGTGRFSRNEGNPLACGLLVIDETSMVDVPLMHSLVKALPIRSGLILVGDVDQLPSVGPGMVLNDLIESEIIPVVRLTEVFRQAADSQIISNAHLIRQGQMPQLRGQSRPPTSILSSGTSRRP